MSIRRLVPAILMLMLPSMSPAATTLLPTAADYVFTHPMLTNSIHGLVIGDTGDYGTIRYEDVAFLEEALKERYILAHEYGTNDFLNAVTNRTHIDYPAIIGNHSLILQTLYSFLAPDCRESTSPRVVKYADSATSNRLITAELVSCTNVCHWATNVLTQVMTNGVTDVYTNAYAGSSFTSNLYVWATVTNTLNVNDFCLESHLVDMTDDRRFVKGPRFPNGPYSRAGMTNWYGMVRDMRRVPPTAFSFTLTSSSNATSTVKIGTDGEPSITKVKSSRYSFEVYKSKSWADADEKRDNSWYKIPGYPMTTTYLRIDSTVPDTLPVLAHNNLCSLALTYRKSGSRINRARAYVHLDGTWTRTLKSYHSTQDGNVFDVDLTTNLTASCVIPVGTVSRAEADNLSFAFNISPGVYRQLCSLTGLPWVDADTDPPLPAVGTPEWNTHSSARDMGTFQSAKDTLTINIYLYLILYLNPTTILESWNEYE